LDSFAATTTHSFLKGGGEMGALLRSHPWDSTPLGPPDRWPQPLKTLVAVMLGSNQPMFVAWGPERSLLYNDGYSEILAAKHPGAIGRDFLEVWSEIRADLLPIVEKTFAGEPVHMDDLELHMERKGYVEETHFAFFYAPVRDETGAVTGLFCACTEISGQVLAERRRGEAEAALRAERDRTRRVLDGMAEGFGLLDREFRVIDINAEGLRMEARARDEIIGKTHWEAWPGSEDSELGRLYKRAMAERTALSIDHGYVWPDGRRAWLETRVYPTDDGLALFWRDVTDRKRAEARLAESESRFRALVNASSDVVYRMSPDWTEMRQLDGRGFLADTEEPSVRWIDEYIFPEDRPHVLAVIEDAIRRKGVFQLEHRVRRADGSAGWTFSRAVPVFGDDGEIIEWFGMASDVSARREAEDRLRESEARLARALDAGELGAWELDLKTLEAWRSPQHDRIFGYETMLPEWTYGMFIEHVLPDDRAAVDAAFQSAIGSSGRWEFECRIRRSDGQERWIWAQGKVEPGADGQPERVKGMVRDITDRRLVEERLRELNDTLEAQVAARAAERDRLWNLSQDLLARADYEGMMSAVSPAWTQILGWSAAELLSRGYATFMHPDDVSPTLAAIRRMAETRQPARFENRIQTRDGAWKHIEWTVAPEPDGVNFIAVGRDLTHAKAREAELHAAQEALRQSQKMEAMGSLTGGVAHDFNNLLTPIIGSLDMLVRKGVGSGRERRLIDAALQSAERARTLVQRLLAFARRQPLQPSAVDVAALAEGMADLIASTVGPKIDVRVEVSADLARAKADPNQLEMALLNLAVNARDAMPEGGEIRITADEETVASTPHPSEVKPGRYIRLSVRDTGLGMDEATRLRAVEPFFSTKGIGKGTGLGLSMVHGLTAQLGGGLSIDSAPGKGTSVTLWLPVSLAPAHGETQSPKPLAAPNALGKALLVDDESVVRMSTADMLIDLGYEVVEAASAEEALRLLADGLEPDLLVTDHLMPGMTGVDLARRLRSTRPGLPVLIVSGYAETDGIEPDIPRLTKPFRSAELAESLASLAPRPAPALA